MATLIYTSGTTGPPKGVMINQYNVVFTVESLKRSIDHPYYAGLRTVSYLPMAHIAERMMGLYQPMLLGYAVHCCPEVNQLSKYLVAAKPQVLFKVPRVWEKIYNSVNAALSMDPDRQQKFNEAVDAALTIKQAERDDATGEQAETWAFLGAVAFKAVRTLVGLDELCMASPAADPAGGARVVQRRRRAAVGDLRDERVLRPDDVEPERPAARHRRPGDPGRR